MNQKGSLFFVGFLLGMLAGAIVMGPIVSSARDRYWTHSAVRNGVGEFHLDGDHVAFRWKK